MLRYAEALQCRGRTGATDAAADILRAGSSAESRKTLIARFIEELPAKLEIQPSDRVKIASGEKLSVTISGGEELSAADAEKIGKVIEDKYGHDAVDIRVERNDAVIGGVCQRGRLCGITPRFSTSSAA